MPESRRLSSLPLSSVFALLAACAASTPPAPQTAAEQTAEEPVATPVATAPAPAAKAETAFPDQCADGNSQGVCGPSAEFVQEVCSGRPKPDAALVLFGKGSPWTRGYVRRNVDAWYTGSRSSKSALKSQEEVIVLRHPKPAGGIIVNGGGGPFDVMRLDGACATLSPEELSLKHPESAKHPAVPWQQLDSRVKQALVTDEQVAQASAAYDDGCRDPGPACAKATSKLTAAIVGFLARGGKVPTLVTWR